MCLCLCVCAEAWAMLVRGSTCLGFIFWDLTRSRSQIFPCKRYILTSFHTYWSLLQRRKVQECWRNKGTGSVYGGLGPGLRPTKHSLYRDSSSVFHRGAGWEGKKCHQDYPAKLVSLWVRSHLRSGLKVTCRWELQTWPTWSWPLLLLPQRVGRECLKSRLRGWRCWASPKRPCLLRVPQLAWISLAS